MDAADAAVAAATAGMGTAWTTPAAPAPPKRPWWRRAWVLPTAIAGIVALLIGVAIGAASTSNTTKTAASPAPVTVSVSLAPSTVTPTVTAAAPTPTKAPTTAAPTTAAPAPPTGTTFKDGTLVVGTDIQPGQYKTNGPPPENKIGNSTLPCSWARLSSLNTNDIIDAGLASGPTTIQVQASDKALETHGGCTWTKIG
jgi:hypothetical protein